MFCPYCGEPITDETRRYAQHLRTLQVKQTRAAQTLQRQETQSNVSKQQIPSVSSEIKPRVTPSPTQTTYSSAVPSAPKPPSRTTYSNTTASVSKPPTQTVSPTVARQEHTPINKKALAVSALVLVIFFVLITYSKKSENTASSASNLNSGTKAASAVSSAETASEASKPEAILEDSATETASEASESETASLVNDPKTNSWESNIDWILVQSNNVNNGILHIDTTHRLGKKAAYTVYFHIKLSSNSPESMSENYNLPYIGCYVNARQDDSDRFELYNWQSVNNLDPNKGLKACWHDDPNVAFYLHTSYAEDDSGKDFSIAEYKDGREYLGYYIDDVENDSLDPQKYHWISRSTTIYGLSSTEEEASSNNSALNEAETNSEQEQSTAESASPDPAMPCMEGSNVEYITGLVKNLFDALGLEYSYEDIELKHGGVRYMTFTNEEYIFVEVIYFPETNEILTGHVHLSESVEPEWQIEFITDLARVFCPEDAYSDVGIWAREAFYSGEEESSTELFDVDYSLYVSTYSDDYPIDVLYTKCSRDLYAGRLKWNNWYSSFFLNQPH